jgi:hypothetical protein
MRRRAGFAEGGTPSPDRLAQILEVVQDRDREELLLETFFQARQSKLLEESLVAGLRLAAIDLNELFCSERVHCAQCQQRRKTVKRGEALEEVIEYYHQVVCLQWLGGSIPWPLGWELLGPGEGELTAGLRLLDRVLPRLDKSLDGVVGDGLYDCRPFWQCVGRHHVAGVVLMTRETSQLWGDIQLYVKTEKPDKTLGLEQMGWKAWQMESDAWEKELDQKLRLVWFEREREQPAYKNERKRLIVATTFSQEQAGLYRLFLAGKARWGIENPGFNTYTQVYHLTHNYHHHPKAILALVSLMSVAHCLKLAYFKFAASYQKAKVALIELREALLDSFVIEPYRPGGGTVHTCSQPPP